jgi:hypothetical protein
MQGGMFYMKKQKIIGVILLIFIVFTYLNNSKVFANQYNYEKEGWNVDFTYNNGIVNINATYTINENDVNEDGTININCNSATRILAYFMRSTSNTANNLNLTIVNNTGKKIKFNDYSFTTENYEKCGNTATIDINNAQMDEGELDRIWLYWFK